MTSFALEKVSESSRAASNLRPTLWCKEISQLFPSQAQSGTRPIHTSSSIFLTVTRTWAERCFNQN